MQMLFTGTSSDLLCIFYFFFFHTSDLIEVEINEIPVLFEVQTALGGEKIRPALAPPENSVTLLVPCSYRKPS